MVKNSLMRDCPACGGSGRVLDPREIGAHMRNLREKSKRSLRTIAANMGLSAPYVSDLERGNRSFTEELIARYKEALK